MKTAVASVATDTRATPRGATLNVKTDPTTLKRFNAACRLLGGTIQATVNDLMHQTISRAGLDSPPDLRNRP